ncbi:alpha/beta fold hydrolase [Muricoccus pecuniae]|uniref:Pimeloyl-ACP methyl ester carboxylesterase n=1 Tax=Muricoccus pecuniae TaxID=693023 RepID=A0A840YFR3_9PROT|nr:alpha/beta hydrolase [Roseomonas pecuniae]MBB5695177.1 pimeloyl-ACP methyl ester carboxylesterase [Roseomonas pecuniae]
MPFIKTRDDVAIHYNDWGTGKPVVLIHGWPLSGAMWEYQSLFLASKGLRVIAYDRRGFGESGKPYTGYDYDTLADDLAALMEGLDLQGATLVGFSMGGGEVARYLARHGASRVAKAVLVSAVTPFMVKTPDHEDGVPRETFDEMVQGLLADRPNFLATFGKKFFGAGLLNFTVTNEILQWAQNLALQASPKATLDCLRAFSETDFRDDMRAFTVPTLVIHGDSDTTVPIDVSGRAAARMIGGARLIEYGGAPHGLFFTEKDRLNADLLSFVNG